MLNKKIKIGDDFLGPGEPVYIIAEIGSNHDGKIEQAKHMIDVAAESGANAVKFQVFAADILYPTDATVNAAVRKHELPRDWIPELKKYADQHSISFFASPFDKAAVDGLDKVGVPAYKVASSEAVNGPLVRYMATRGKPMIVSTGMCDLADVYEVVEIIKAVGNNDIILLQCTAIYPSEPRHVHLRVMDLFREGFQCPVGLSDHTLGMAIPLAAVAMGASIIEKHITTSRALSGPDHSYAMEPNEFKEMVSSIRSVEAALGDPMKVMLSEEALYARRESIHATRAINKGERLSMDALNLTRPGTGSRPRFLQSIVGQIAHESIKRGEPVTWEKLAK